MACCHLPENAYSALKSLSDKEIDYYGKRFTKRWNAAKQRMTYETHIKFASAVDKAMEI